MSRILNDATLENEDANSIGGAYRCKAGKHVELERTLFDWVCDMCNSRKCISGAIIRTNAIQLARKGNEPLSSDAKISIQFSDGWLEKFKKRWKLNSYKLHGDAGDVDKVGDDNALEIICSTITNYALKDVLHCDESGLLYQMAPDRTIADSTFSWRKVQKSRFKLLECCNSDGTERLPFMFIGTALKPPCFKNKLGHEHVLYYKNNKKVWMTASFFFDWLHSFERNIRQTEGRKILLLIDNCISHGNIQIVPDLYNFEIYFLSPNITSQLQPLDGGII